MHIVQVTEQKKRYLPLLLLADPQEDMIDRYLEQGDLYVLLDPDVCCVSVVLPLAGDMCELKNLAVAEPCQRRGYGSAMVRHRFSIYGVRCREMLVGTGDSPLTLPFYQQLGFVYSHTEAGFFTRYYRAPLYEAGRQLVDMIYLKKRF